MSYCRWSSDNFQCDIYAYESDMGFMVHVASNKTVGEPPRIDYSLLNSDRTTDDMQEFRRQSQENSKWLESCEHAPLGLPFDGQTFTLETMQEFYDKMIELRKVGYRFPDWVLKNIELELSPT
jgi:hypothetical protein